MTDTLYISSEQQWSLDTLLHRFKDNPTGLKYYLGSKEMFTDPELKPLYSMDIVDIMYAYHKGYEVQYDPDLAVAQALQRWEKEYNEIVEDHIATFAESQLLWGRIQGARYVLRSLGIDLPTVD